MAGKVETYPIISLPGNKYQIYTEQALNTDNPSEIAPSDTENLFNDKDLNYPAIVSAVSLPGDRYGIYTNQALNTDNPGEITGNSQIFVSTSYYELDYNQNPNAFRNDRPLGYQNPPNEKFREGGQNLINSIKAKKEIDKNNIGATDFNQQQYNFKIFGKK